MSDPTACGGPLVLGGDHAMHLEKTLLRCCAPIALGSVALWDLFLLLLIVAA